MIQIEVTARRARDADRDRLDQLVAQARAALVEQRGGRSHLGIDGSGWTLADRLSDPQAIVLVGTIDGAVIGYAVVSYRLTEMANAGRIEAIFVEPDAREVGVGEELLNAAIEWCQSHRCSAMDAVALPGDRHTKNFFETFGMVARAIVVSRSLPPR